MCFLRFPRRQEIWRAIYDCVASSAVGRMRGRSQRVVVVRKAAIYQPRFLGHAMTNIGLRRDRKISPCTNKLGDSLNHAAEKRVLSLESATRISRHGIAERLHDRQALSLFLSPSPCRPATDATTLSTERNPRRLAFCRQTAASFGGNLPRTMDRYQLAYSIN